MNFHRISSIFFSVFALFCFCTLSAQAFAEDLKREKFFESELQNFEDSGYETSVKNLFTSYEKSFGKIKLGEKKKVGIKVYSNSGAGLATPLPLLRAVIKELELRGYKKEQICIVDLSRRKLREAGFLPTYTKMLEGAEDKFDEKSFVYDIDSGNFFHKDWFYDNPLMPKIYRFDKEYETRTTQENRKSYLPVPLFLTVDFWINLPVAFDIEGLGISGALANMTIWNMSNNDRFFRTPANAPIAVAEVAAIPELKDSLIFTILSLESVQYIGGPIFNAAYTLSEKRLLLSANPVVLDYIALEYINIARVKKGFQAISPLPVIFDYARQMQLGDYELQKIKHINADK